MKKLILFFLLLAGTETVLRAQTDPPDAVENLFDNPKTSRGSASFTFFLTSHTRVVLDLKFVSQVPYLPNADSMLRSAIAWLAPLKDSLRDDGIVRRVDIVMRNEIPKIRMVAHPEIANTYTVKDNDLLQLKVGQDTIRLIGIANSNVKGVVFENGMPVRQTLTGPFSISIITDNIADLEKIGERQLGECIELLRSSVAKDVKWDRLNANAINYRASFLMQNKKMIWPNRMSYIFVGEPVVTLSAAFTMSYAKGTVLPGLSMGVDYNRSRYNGYTNKWRLYVEQQAYFSRDAATNRIQTEWNRFVGIQLLAGKPTDKFSLMGNLNLSYLLNKKSSLYEPNTFRFSMPVIATKRFTFEPYIVFNGVFKNVSPGIRILLNF